jgi:hypothetical protein
MSVQVTTAHVQQYKAVLQQLMQQKGSRLRRAVTVEQFYGKAAKAIEQVGAVAITKLTTRHGDTPRTDTPHAARWIIPDDYAGSDMVDNEDKLKMLVDPQSIYSKNWSDGVGRAMDDEILRAAFGTCFVGENGTTSETFDATNWDVAVGGVGLTVAKLRNARRLLGAAEADPDEEYFCVLSWDQIEDMLGETLLVSIDYNTMKPLADGKITSFMGLNFIQSERITLSGGNDWVLVYPRSALMLGLWNDIEVRVDQLPTRNYATQVYVCASFGATRTHNSPTLPAQGGKVVRVLCVP